MLTRDYILSQLKIALRDLSEYLDDPLVSEVMVNPGGRVFVERAGEMIFLKDLRIKDYDIEVAIKQVGKLVHQDPLPNSPTSLISASVGDLRIAGGLAPASFGGHSLCIRKHQKPGSRPSIWELVERGMLTREKALILVDYFVKKRRNVIVGGSTGSGKTTVCNALLKEVPAHERVLSIEDSIELDPGLDHHVQFLVNEAAGVTAQALVKHALRFRPDRLILGETRGTETYDLIRGFNSGHDGSLSTVHASSPEDVCGALEMLFQMSLPPNASLSTEASQRFIARAVHMIVYVSRRIEEEDGRLKSVRTINDIVLVKGVKDGFFDLEKIA